MTSVNGTVLILGAASDIGRAIGHEYARGGLSVILAARDCRRLETDAADLRLRHAVAARAVEFDVLDSAGFGGFLDRLGALPETVICVVGLLGDQAVAQISAAAAELVMRTNYLGCSLVLGEVATRMAARGSGCIIGMSSVAGERGRAKNYIYGSAKAGLTALLSGLRNRLARRGVRVITIQPGFVETRMTQGMALPKILTAQPDEVARAVYRAQARGKNVVYVRPIWRWIMRAIRALPERIFMRTDI
ncbi:MAG TPA: SDR family oxidoreductase [Stellaceae bacterium]|nr:SDR family oxidoreductase [Stellaceae bacterium]